MDILKNTSDYPTETNKPFQHAWVAPQLTILQTQDTEGAPSVDQESVSGTGLVS